MLVLTVALGLALLLPQQKTAIAKPMTQDEVIKHAIEIAQRNGLIGEPSEITVGKMNYADFYTLLDDVKFIAGDNNLPVWLIVMKGTVRIEVQPPKLEGPAPPLEFDNIYVLLNATTGEVLELGARMPGHEIKVPAEWKINWGK
jgi:hypothetical protein